MEKKLARFVLLLALAGCRHGGGEALPAPGAGSFASHSYSNAAGTRSYKLYVPAGLDLATPPPLVVELHGCTSSADEEARWSRMNEIAGARGMLVVYPEQDPNANGGHCWNWFLPDDQSRDAGEPSLIAGITQEVMAQWHVDPRRVYVGGISAGGAMSVVMAATYPDLYAAAMVYAGCEYKGTTCTGGPAALPAEVSGQMAYAAMGNHARVVPVIVIQGDIDTVVPPVNAEFIVQQFLAADDWSDDGANDSTIGRSRSSTRSGTSPGGQAYDVDDYTDAAGCLLAERWLVHGMGHQWSDTPSDGSTRDLAFTDPNGPDVTTPIVEFFLSHPKPASGVACHQS